MRFLCKMFGDIYNDWYTYIRELCIQFLLVKLQTTPSSLTVTVWKNKKSSKYICVSKMHISISTSDKMN